MNNDISKIMDKKCVKPEKPFHLTLNDCLACSGCITEKSDIIKPADLSFLKNNAYFSLILSPHSKINTYNYYKNQKITEMDYESYEAILNIFLKKNFNIKEIIDVSSLRETILKNIYKEYLENECVIISDCPGTVTYIEKTAPHLIKYLSKVKSPQQLAHSILSGVVVSVVPCYDKKLENNRDNINFDHILTTSEFFEMLENFDFRSMLVNDYKKIDKKNFMEITQWNLGSNSGGYIEYITGKYNIVKKINIKKGVIEYEIATENKTIKCIQITGIENSINFFNSTKKNSLSYKLVEIFICSDSCINGPGRIKEVPYEQDLEIYEKVGNIFPDTNIDENKIKDKRTFKAAEVKRINFEVDW